MKNKNLVLALLAISFALVFNACTKEDTDPKDDDNILPARFAVAVPDAITRTDAGKKSYSGEDTLKGSDIYQHLGLFIAVGHGAGQIVEGIIGSISYYHINKPLSLSYESDDDGRAKNLIVFEESSFEDVVWDFQMNISDAESEGNVDGGIGLQIFWNTNPIKGIAILKPYNIDRTENKSADQAVYRIEYSEAGEDGYEAQMVVSIAGLPLENPLVAPFSIRTLKMFAGKKDDMVDVYGNSNHPNARFFNSDAGFNWAFVASADKTNDRAVAEVGLPPSSLNETSRTVLLEDYSIKNVFTNQITSVWPGIDQSIIDGYLYNAGAPGFFNESGFIQGGISPGTEYDGLEERISVLSPYNPSIVSSMELEFKLN
jgi:hypothetical protein